MADVCAEPGCDRTVYANHRCRAHHERIRAGRPITGPITTDPVVLGDDVFMACPDSLLPLAGQVAEFDARHILRTIWPHFLEASLAGVEPFTTPPREAA